MDKINKTLNLLIALALVLAGVVFFYLKDSDNINVVKKNTMSQVESKKVDETVNKHLRLTSNQAQLSEQRNIRGLREAEIRLSEEKKKALAKSSEEQSTISADQQIWKKSNLTEPTYEIVNRVQPKPVENEILKVQDMTPDQKKEYAKQYIDNAKKGGYLIELSDDLEVIKSTPIRKPSQQNDSIESLPTD